MRERERGRQARRAAQLARVGPVVGPGHHQHGGGALGHGARRRPFFSAAEPEPRVPHVQRSEKVRAHLEIKMFLFVGVRSRIQECVQQMQFISILLLLPRWVPFSKLAPNVV